MYRIEADGISHGGGLIFLFRNFKCAIAITWGLVSVFTFPCVTGLCISAEKCHKSVDI